MHKKVKVPNNQEVTDKMKAEVLCFTVAKTGGRTEHFYRFLYIFFVLQKNAIH